MPITAPSDPPATATKGPSRPRRVLLTNDDGIAAPGLDLLARLVGRHGGGAPDAPPDATPEGSAGIEVWVVAPERDQSGMSRAASLNAPLRVERRGERRYAVSGTPSDCVIMALRHLMRDTPPDLVLSGINRGANLAEEVPYSGTVGAAMTARLLGVPAVALSQACRRGHDVSWGTVEALFGVVMAPLLGAPHDLRHGPGIHPANPAGEGSSDRGGAPDWAGWSPAFLAEAVANINFPDRAPGTVRGLRVTRQGRGHVRDIVVEARQDLRGGDYHWLSFQRHAAPPEHELGQGALTRSPRAASPDGGMTDVDAVRQGYVSLTPVGFDLTHTMPLAPGLAPGLHGDGETGAGSAGVW